jgi:hypothetical protein
MARDTALVDGVLEVVRERAPRGAKKAEGVISVRFDGGAAARLDPASARDRTWADVLASLKETRQSAYIEIDPKTRFITSVLLPRVLSVIAIREMPGVGDLEIDLEISHARHYLRRDHSRFDELWKLLERARRDGAALLVTESLDGSAIVDVRPPVTTGTTRRKRRPS